MILTNYKTFPIAGHHNADPGAVYNGQKEADLTKEARSLFVKYFPNGKNELILDRDNETNLQLQRRIKPGAGSVLLDIHFNAGPRTATGTECLVNRKDFVNKNSMSYRMADEISKATSEILGIPNRGVKCESTTRHGRLGILNLGAGCSVLWEICFISNPNDMEQWDLKKEILMKKIAEIAAKYDDIR
ncbi:N-acetylmuramoyl-L-alanine amidase [Riemerella anatipestifer]|uniref:N-acetylmuramoyl-L-alanine amidase n=1 Tax=Riemerella anatipestifer TaxID=34085 RepID=UPI0013727BBA|nr:N-acetylmuramoyl-L-alanine amidase [Riemerella anatipestifer]MBT0549167.1 N-acetylmuramoyl-L-alanine amidase [Riemerella anatipestifer]MBT0556164.1 N-acetylmuramoyl-L-alanine amidase [Riemerella anatipestifer]MBT0559930.1 N-acetylmuramoyl-L-alanine amidase [Riemerella anatipestifer]NAV16290.1 N-acetylmuramoyl-L-alanine amidase [Riemerella anatipestifer]